MEIQVLKDSIRKTLLTDAQARQRIAVDVFVGERTIYNLAKAEGNPKANAKLLSRVYSKAIRKSLGIPSGQDLFQIQVLDEETT